MRNSSFSRNCFLGGNDQSQYALSGDEKHENNQQRKEQTLFNLPAAEEIWSVGIWENRKFKKYLCVNWAWNNPLHTLYSWHKHRSLRWPPGLDITQGQPAYNRDPSLSNNKLYKTAIVTNGSKLKSVIQHACNTHGSGQSISQRSSIMESSKFSNGSI